LPCFFFFFFFCFRWLDWEGEGRLNRIVGKEERGKVSLCSLSADKVRTINSRKARRRMSDKHYESKPLVGDATPGGKFKFNIHLWNAIVLSFAFFGLFVAFSYV